MAEAPKQDGAAAGAAPKAPEPPKRNPAFRALGIPNIRWRLPSRNWMIFLTITGSWTAAIMYDRREKKKNQRKWCDLVAHIAQQPLPADQMARKITVFLSAPPGDGIRPSREYFKEYVKPILVAAAMDYDVIEGRKEGDVRYGTAEQIRRLRRKNGENHAVPEEMDTQKAIEQVREKMQITSEPAPRGDLVLGRHTWKEYIRGLHEGWLGPLDPPPDPAPEPQPTPFVHTTGESSDSPEMKTIHESEGQTEEKKEEKPEEKPEEKKKPYPPPAYLPISTYPSSALAPTMPAILEPSQPIYQYHLLGFLKTPIRVWNYLNQRTLADNVGRETAAIVLAASRPYYTSDSSFSEAAATDESFPVSSPDSDAPSNPSNACEQASLLAVEERTWHKSVRKPLKEGDDSERIWVNDMAIDPRIADRMRRFELDFEEAARAERIGRGEEKTRAYEVQDLRNQPVKRDLAYEDD